MAENTVTITKTITRLLLDCSWKDRAIFKCNVCKHELIEYSKSEPENYTYGEAHAIAKAKMSEHILTCHPEFCNSCAKCPLIFITKGELKKRKHPKI